MHSQDHKAKLDYVWYACYGSNLAQGRFLCYLQGGQYPGNRKAYKGARNKAAPTHSEKYTLNHPLYFAKEAHIWGGGNTHLGWAKSRTGPRQCVPYQNGWRQKIRLQPMNPSDGIEAYSPFSRRACSILDSA